MIFDILTVLFFVLGFFLILWMIGQRRRDVLYGPYVTRRPGRAVIERRRKNVPANGARGLAALRAFVLTQKSWAKPRLLKWKAPHAGDGCMWGHLHTGGDADRATW
jgi:hypothetical protein